jgi:hypothetical protein
MKKAKNMKRFISIIFLSMISILSGQEQNGDETFFKEPLNEYGLQRGLCGTSGDFNNGIQFFQDQAGSKFVLKRQPTKEYSIHEVLGARIGQILGESLVNKVIPAPADLATPYGTATLHTHAMGTEVRSSCIRSRVDIKEGIANYENLKSISWNKDLAKIVALNLYLDDRDSHQDNLFFDITSHRFCAIDKGLIFQTSYDCKYANNSEFGLHYILPARYRQGYYRFDQLLASDACDFLEFIKKEELTAGEIQALKEVNTTLQSLIAAYPPAKIHAEWMALAEDLDFKYPDETKENISILVEYNHHENKRLVKLIDKLTQ